jgi:hypothetical protein
LRRRLVGAGSMQTRTMGVFKSGQNQGAKNVGFWVPGHRFAEVR